jgi:HSP20 family molecular chaperone IbpA
MALEEFRSGLNELEGLRIAWAETPEGRGGILALRGFHYQLSTALTELVRNWLGKSPADRSLPLLVEALSDWVVEEDKAIVACQVKLTESSKAVSSALSEFWSINGLASNCAPQWRERLAYRILSRRGGLKSVERAIERWRPRGEFEPQELEQFLLKVSAKIEPEPELELLGLLANRLHAANPIHKLNSWLGHLLRGAGSEGGFEQALLFIWSDLFTLEAERRQPPPGYLWTDHDRPPDEIISGPVLVGQRPSVEQLREGFFANRSEAYETLVAEAVDWLSSVAPRALPKLRILWIGGRSGSGKTVALLHILARLYQRGEGVVIWLDEHYRLLPEAVRWCRPLLRDGRQVIIGVDDMYSPFNQAEVGSILSEVDAELLAIRQDARAASMPHIICCGPTEQRIRLKREQAGIIDLCSVDLPKETEEELRSLWDWFCLRTGQNLPMPYDGISDVLLVQLFFEWGTGQSMEEFAQRFRKRIIGMDRDHSSELEPFLARMLAVNRLYVTYPVGALAIQRREPSFEAALRRLMDEEHHVTIESGSASGLRLTHPHLANAIYNSWFDPVEDESYRRAHLATSIMDALEFGKDPRERTALLWALARCAGASAHDGLSGRITPESVIELLEQVYTGVLARLGDPMPVWMYPVWIELSVTLSALELRPSPIDRALGILNAGQMRGAGMRLLCHKLLQHLRYMNSGQQEFAIHGIRRLLEEFPFWYEWAPVAADYVRTTRRLDLGPTIRARVWRDPTHDSVPRLLEVALRAAGGKDVLEATMIWLASSDPEHPSWTFVWQDVFREAPRNSIILKMGRQWLDMASPFNPSWGHVWQDLHHAAPADDELLKRGRLWLNQTNQDHGSWSFVWQDLRKAWQDSQDLYELGLGWLESMEINDRSWSFVWENLHFGKPYDADLLNLGRFYLEQSDHKQRSWSYIWQHLWAVTTGAEYLVVLAKRWLAEEGKTSPSRYFILKEVGPYMASRSGARQFERILSTDQSNWGSTWSRLQTLNRAELIEEASRIIEEQTHGPQWAGAWLILNELGLVTRELLKKARAWLMTTPFMGSKWRYLWEVVYRADGRDQELFERGVSCLETLASRDVTWNKLWGSLFKAKPKDGRLFELGLDWLKHGKPLEHGSRWGEALQILLRAQPDNEELFSLGLGHLSAIRRGGWITLWNALRNIRLADDRLLIMARNRLSETPTELPLWVPLWHALFTTSSGVTKESLYDEGLLWLKEHAASSAQAQIVLATFIQHKSDDEELWSIGLRWMEDHAGEGRALQVWSAMFANRPTEARLLDIGFRCLRSLQHVEAWPLWWEVARRNIPDDEELLTLAFEWLAHNLMSTKWANVWQALNIDVISDEIIEELAMPWLREAPGGSSGWAAVWNGLWSRRPLDSDLVRLGRSWLEKSPSGTEGWARVWSALYSASPDEVLEREAEIWLSQTSATPDRSLVLNRLSGAKSAGSPRIVAVESLFDVIQEIHRSIALRAYQLFEARDREPGQDREDWFRAESELVSSVDEQVVDAEDNVTIIVDLFGFEAEDTVVGIELGRIVIIAERQASDEVGGVDRDAGLHRFWVFRTIDLPSKIDPTMVRATFQNGKLEISLHKAIDEANTAEQLTIQVGRTTELGRVRVD